MNNPPSFDEWLAANAGEGRMAQPMTFAQYGRYIAGWQKSMPWAYNGMSVAYFWWAMSAWQRCQDREALKLAWRAALWHIADRLQRGRRWEGTAEECADLFLFIFFEKSQQAKESLT